MKRRWLLLAVLALVGVVLLAKWYSVSTNKDTQVTTQAAAPADSTPLSMQWYYGVAQRYQVLSESSMQMQATAQGAATIRVHMQGLLDTLTLETGSDGAVVGMRLSSVDLKINDTQDAATNRALGVPFRVRFAANGMPLAFEFPAEVNQQNRSILENLVRTFQVSLDSSADNWVTNETNGSGTYEASYQRIGPAHIEKSKRKFNTTAAGMVSWSEISSSESFSIEAGRNWIAAMNVQETMRSDDQGGPAMMVSNHATLKLLPGIQLALSPDLWRFDAVAATVGAASAVKRPVPDITPEEARKLILATVPELDAATQGRLGLIHRLRDLLRVDDSLPAVILDVLKTQELNDRTRADLYLALEQAGTQSAQAALVEVITDDSWSLEDGMRAIVAMGGIKQPTTESVSALWNMAQSSSGDERQRMANSATFALGSIGNTMNKADNPEYESIRSGLLSNALGGGDATQRANYIIALGNTHDPTLANDVVTLLDDADPAIRRATALSLGSLGTDQVADRLVSHYRAEDNGYVRGAIAESLQSWTEPTDSAMVMFRQTVRSETDESTRYNIAVLLSENLDKFPENESVLREIMRTEPSKRIRQKVAEALSVHQSQP
jgi:HEAT repeat protein